MAKIALLIGVSEYEPGLNPLPAAVRDVEALQKVLLNPAIGGFAESDVVLLKNPDRQTMEEAIETLFTDRSKDDLVLLFFSGHGIKDDAGRLFLTTRATRKTPRGDLVRSTAIQSNFIQDSMSRSRSKRQVVILDSCFSGAFAEGLSAKDDGTIDIRSQLGGEGRAILTSSSSTQYSFEHEGSELSLYTRFLIEGIQTGAADLDQDDVVSIDELHEYSSRKVREIKPELKPEIFTTREGFKIRLTKVPEIDPREKYRKKVAEFTNRGDISLIGRRTLNVLINNLKLSETEAAAIEHEVLEPYRIQFRKSLHEYEQAFGDTLKKGENLSEIDREQLRQLQQVLGLRNEDTMPIEAMVTSKLRAYQQQLQEYEQVFRKTLGKKHPLSHSKRVELTKIQKKLALIDVDIAPIEAKVIAEIETYSQHLEQYKQAFVEAITHEYPLSESKRGELRQQYEPFGLTHLDFSAIEAQVVTETETYQNNLHEYEQAFFDSIQYEYPLSEVVIHELSGLQKALELRDKDIKIIEEKFIAQKQLSSFSTASDSEIELTQLSSEKIDSGISEEEKIQEILPQTEEVLISEEPSSTIEHQEKLNKYQQEFLKISHISHDHYKRRILKQLQSELGLTDEDVAFITLDKNNPPSSVSVKYPIEKPSDISSKKSLSSNKKRLLGLFSLFGMIIVASASVLLPNLSNQLTKAIESKGKSGLGAINRAQQAFHFEKSEFAPDLKSLEISLSSTHYNFSIPKPSVAIAVPIRTTDNLKSYIGGVSFNPTTQTYTIVICRQTGSEPLTIKNITGYGVVKEGGVACGPNTEEVQ